jgi:hypothetical protein
MTANNRASAVLTAVAAFVLAIPAQATIARAVSFNEKVEGADAIIVGKCSATRSDWDASHRWIVTYSTFQVEKALKGQPVNEITVVMPGGQVGSLHQGTVGIPEFHAGQSNVLFVQQTPLGPTVAFADQGAYDVATDSKGTRVVIPKRSPDVVRIDTQRGVAVDNSELDGVRSLDQFERDVHDSLQRARRQQMSAIAPKPHEDRGSLVAFFTRNRVIIVLAGIGIAVAAWQLFLRR